MIILCQILNLQILQLSFQVNAMYNPQGNDIWVPLGIQNFPIYQEDSIPALTYGSLGMVLGHELTHGFDSTGALFDKDGNLRVTFKHLII